MRIPAWQKPILAQFPKMSITDIAAHCVKTKSHDDLIGIIFRKANRNLIRDLILIASADPLATTFLEQNSNFTDTLALEAIELIEYNCKNPDDTYIYMFRIAHIKNKNILRKLINRPYLHSLLLSNKNLTITMKEKINNYNLERFNQNKIEAFEFYDQFLVPLLEQNKKLNSKLVLHLLEKSNICAKIPMHCLPKNTIKKVWDRHKISHAKNLYKSSNIPKYIIKESFKILKTIEDLYGNELVFASKPYFSKKDLAYIWENKKELQVTLPILLLKHKKCDEQLATKILSFAYENLQNINVIKKLAAKHIPNTKFTNLTNALEATQKLTK